MLSNLRPVERKLHGLYLVHQEIKKTLAILRTAEQRNVLQNRELEASANVSFFLTISLDISRSFNGFCCNRRESSTIVARVDTPAAYGVSALSCRRR